MQLEVLYLFICVTRCGLIEKLVSRAQLLKQTAKLRVHAPTTLGLVLITCDYIQYVGYWAQLA